MVEEMGIAGETYGTVQEWNEKGMQEFPITDCSSGAREGFYGVTLHTPSRRRSVRFVRNPVGPMTVAIDTTGDEASFVAIECHALEGSIKPTGWRVNNVTVLAGTVRFACQGLRGSAVFTCS